MLTKTPFLTADELGLNECYYKGLLITLDKLERGELVHCEADQPDLPNGFNMAVPWEVDDCGTVGCIAGWAQHFGRAVNMETYVGLNGYDAHLRLTCPPDWRSGRHTVAQAAQALRSYLTCGEADWS